jgi:hypothetical protein
MRGKRANGGRRTGEGGEEGGGGGARARKYRWCTGSCLKKNWEAVLRPAI